jgi:hypothetical protein
MELMTKNKVVGDRLARWNRKRIGVAGTVKRYGARDGVQGWQEMVLLIDVTDHEGLPLADELWMNAGKTVCTLGAVTGDRISFEAIVAEYRGDGGKPAHKLSYPIKLNIDSSTPSLFPEETLRLPGMGVELALATEVKEPPFDRKGAIEKIRAAAADGMICLEPEMRKVGGFWGVRDAHLVEMLGWLEFP